MSPTFRIRWKILTSQTLDTRTDTHKQTHPIPIFRYVKLSFKKKLHAHIQTHAHTLTQTLTNKRNMISARKPSLLQIFTAALCEQNIFFRKRTFIFWIFVGSVVHKKKAKISIVWVVFIFYRLSTIAVLFKVETYYFRLNITLRIFFLY